MFSISNIPTTTTVLSTYTTFAASAMLARTVLNELQSLTNNLVPQQLRNILIAKLESLMGNISSKEITLTIDEFSDQGSAISNELFKASDTYLSTKITPSNSNLKATKTAREKQVSVTVNKGEKIVDEFNGFRLTWEYFSTESSKSYFNYDTYSEQTMNSEKKTFRLRFDKRFAEVVMRDYLPHVIESAKAIEEEKKVVKIMSLGNFGDYESGYWRSVEFRHPSTFETLAMEERAKRELVDDLERFLKRREFYKRVGKAWKRGYLLYGPPGTGKSSLIAAMANYLKFNIYYLELTQLESNSELTSLIVSTDNKSIIVIEDVDCSVKLGNRAPGGGYKAGESRLTLSGLLNFLDGLWSSYGDERIIVFTTNYKERLDPALLRPGRMDMHIHMSYCTPFGFKTLAFNYLQITTHRLFDEIEKMLNEVEMTPAEVAEELMRSDNADLALEGLVDSLRRKKEKKLVEQVSEIDEEEINEDVNEERESLKEERIWNEGMKISYKRRGRGRGRGKRGRF